MTDTVTTTAEQLSNMIAPGQEALVEAMLDDLEAGRPSDGIAEAPHPLDALLDAEEKASTGEDGRPAVDDGLPEKFKGKTAAEIAAAYMALEKKQAERGIEPDPTPDSYTPELGEQTYGAGVATAITAAEINPFAMAAKMRAGEDVTAEVNALVEKGGLPRGLVETYLAGVAPAAAPAAEGGRELSVAEGAAIRASIGGDAAFAQLGDWMKGNLSAAELTGYNAVVDGGNPDAIRFALAQIKARSSGPAAPAKEAKPIGGFNPAGEKFGSIAELQDAMAKTDDKGRPLYYTNERYQRQVDAQAARSGDLR